MVECSVDCGVMFFAVVSSMWGKSSKSLCFMLPRIMMSFMGSCSLSVFERYNFRGQYKWVVRSVTDIIVV